MRGYRYTSPSLGEVTQAIYDITLNRVRFCINRIRRARPLLTEEQAKALIDEYIEGRIQVPDRRRRYYRSPSLGIISPTLYRVTAGCLTRTFDIIRRQQRMGIFEVTELIKEVKHERIKIELIEQCYRVSVLKEYYAREKRRERTPEPVAEFRAKIYVYCRGEEEECRRRLLDEYEGMLRRTVEEMEGLFSSIVEAQAQNKLSDRWLEPQVITVGVECEPIDEDEKEVGVEPGRIIRLAIFYMRYGEPRIYNEIEIREIERSIVRTFGVTSLREIMRRLRESARRMRRE